MYNYRLATVDDLEPLLEMGRKFHESQIEAMVPIPYDHDSAVLAALSMIDEGLLVVAVQDPDGTKFGDPAFGSGPLVGMLGLEYFQYRFNLHYKMCKEVMFWVEPEHRGQKLAAEMLAVAGVGAGADDVDYSALVELETSPEHTKALYRALGYRPFETTWLRSVKQED